jgi:excisionase family DNA binding protein
MPPIPNSQLPAFPPGGDRVITINEVSLRTGCSVSTLKRCAKRGELRILRLSPRRIGIRLSDFQAFLSSRTAS